MKIKLLLMLPIFGLLSFTSTFAQDTLKTYIFGHSLINHELQVNQTPSQETSVPHWFHFLAEEDGNPYAVSGQYGFIPQHANLPPSAQWVFDSVAPAWDSNNYPFSYPDFDNILITPGNFIQWQPPSVPYWQDTLSPLDYTNTIFDWVNQQEDSLILYVYENWPDMGGFLSQGFPPTSSEWTAYNNYLQGPFHDWFIEYHDSLIIAHPDHCVRMIPTGPVIGNLLMQSPFDQIAIDMLYEDDAPHGRPTIYFLAALVTYMAMYETPAPDTYQVPVIIDPIVANNYQQAVDFIWNELLNFNLLSGESRVFCSGSASLQDEDYIELQVYPNPTENQLEVLADQPIKSLEFLDMSGRLLIVQSENKIDLSNFKTGTYHLKVIFENGQVVLKRVIKN
ncbi:MAG: T9SS type A sorting domain-containing protein [Crocinitomicaceae bacterium]|nr:T9SS type A sorting domain-containing protein [Crocinitomicaceae bacterium]